MKPKFYLSVSIYFLLLSISSYSQNKFPDKTKELQKADAPTLFLSHSAEPGENWVFRKNKNTGKDEKFFGIGFWHVPGYPSPKTPDLEELNAAIFKERTAYCNIVFMDARFIKPYMNEKIRMISNFSNTVHSYLDGLSFLPNGADKDYYRAQYLKANVSNPSFVNKLDSSIDYLMHQYKDFDRIYAPIDEIALGGVSKWSIPVVVGDKMRERIKMKENNPIVFVDLLGHGRGSSFFFEQNYLKEHSALPAAPPYDLLSTQAQANKKIPLLGFYQSHNGVPVYKFDDKGNYFYNEFNRDTLMRLWYENVKQIALAYASNGDVFSINAFRDFYTHPVLSGVTVDALKAALGNKPVWLYFDGNGYAKPSNISPQHYVSSVKCQIYTSIIHGATGIFFWNDWSKTPEVFDALLPMLKVLNEDLPVIKLNTSEYFAKGDLHWIKKTDKKGKKYIIIANTSPTDKIPVNIRGFAKKELNPLEAFVSPL